MEQIAAAAGSETPAAAAAGLIAEFETFPAALNGSLRRQLRATGNDQAAVRALQSVRVMLAHALTVQLAARPILSDWQTLIDYLKFDMGYATIERFRVLHLNSRNMLIRDEIMSEGSIDQAMVHVREVIHRALDLGSASIILVHNHPSGEVSASRSDIDITRAVAEAAKRLGITLHDHLIIGARGHRSLRAEGLL